MVRTRKNHYDYYYYWVIFCTDYGLSSERGLLTLSPSRNQKYRFDYAFIARRRRRLRSSYGNTPRFLWKDPHASWRMLSFFLVFPLNHPSPQQNFPIQKPVVVGVLAGTTWMLFFYPAFLRQKLGNTLFSVFVHDNCREICKSAGGNRFLIEFPARKVCYVKIKWETNVTFLLFASGRSFWNCVDKSRTWWSKQLRFNRWETRACVILCKDKTDFQRVWIRLRHWCFERMTDFCKPSKNRIILQKIFKFFLQRCFN